MEDPLKFKMWQHCEEKGESLFDVKRWWVSAGCYDDYWPKKNGGSEVKTLQTSQHL